MMIEDKLSISDEYSMEDYINLKLDIDSPFEIWQKAIDIFASRINGRYFNAIDKLSGNGNKKEMQKYGFAIVTIECLLIDTFVKFTYGFEHTKPNNYKNRTKSKYVSINDLQTRNDNKLKGIYENQNYFCKFLKNAFPEDFTTQKKALKFYKDIRCGVMHTGSTTNSSRLTCDANQLATFLPNGDISVDIYILSKKLKEYFLKYIENILLDKNDLRKNFIIAMNRMCTFKSE